MRIGRRVLHAIARHAREEAPRECCGLLVAERRTIVAACRARNRARGTRRYIVDPHDHFAALRFARARRAEVVGAYHSHPVSTARPSETDRRQAHPAFLYVIVAPRPGDRSLVRPRFAAFVRVGGNLRSLRIVPVKTRVGAAPSRCR